MILRIILHFSGFNKLHIVFILKQLNDPLISALLVQVQNIIDFLLGNLILILDWLEHIIMHTIGRLRSAIPWTSKIIVQGRILVVNEELVVESVEQVRYMEVVDEPMDEVIRRGAVVDQDGVVGMLDMLAVLNVHGRDLVSVFVGVETVQEVAVVETDGVDFEFAFGQDGFFHLFINKGVNL